MKLKNKTAIVTGGCGCIGGAIARALASEGARVIRFDLNAAPSTGAGGETVLVDLTDPAAVREQVDAAVDRHGRLDILVHCAGGSARARMKNFHEQSLDVVRDVIGVNLFGGLYCIHAAAPHLIAGGGGTIVNIGSTVGVQGLCGCVDYAAAKGALIAATKSLAKELGPHNITVNCVSPGQILREPPDDPDAHARRYSVLNRIGTPEDIAGLVLYLTLPEAGFITGQNVIVDGGRSLGMMGSDLRGSASP